MSGINVLAVLLYLETFIAWCVTCEAIDVLSLTIHLVPGMRYEELHGAQPYSQLLQDPYPSRSSNLFERGSCAATVRNNLWLLNLHTYSDFCRYIMDAGQSLDGTVNNDEDPRGPFSLHQHAMHHTQRSAQLTYKRSKIERPCAIVAYSPSPVNGSDVPIARRTCARSARRWIHTTRLIYS